MSARSRPADVDREGSTEAFAERFGSSFDERFAEPLAHLAAHGLVHDDGSVIALTETGKLVYDLVYDLVLLAFYPTAVRQRIEARQAS